MRAYLADGDSVRCTEDYEQVKRAYDAGERIWVSLTQHDPHAERLLLETLGVHTLAIEDLWGERESPKVEDFGEYLHIIAHGFHLLEKTRADQEIRLGDRSVVRCELDLLLSPRFLVTHSERPELVDPLGAELLKNPRLFSRGPAWIAHALLDHLVDDFLPVLDGLDEEIHLLETDVMEHAGTVHGKRTMRRIFGLKRMLLRMRRHTVHQREVLQRLSRSEFEQIPAELAPFFRDVYDHFLRVSDLTEGSREILNGLLEAYLSVQGNRMNEIVKTLTLISTVMLPLSFIAGVYGMNFRHMPELEWRLGYPYALSLMALVSIGILAWFRRKRWL